MRFVGPLLSVLALTLFAGFLAVALPDALKHAGTFLDRAAEHSGETVLEQCTRFWGESFTQSIEEMRPFRRSPGWRPGGSAARNGRNVPRDPSAGPLGEPSAGPWSLRLWRLSVWGSSPRR
ncbi:MAG TPA: hypothetical protein VKM72_08185 [Thermoanaerobaculia bacterium]|nr:hypothetical protein [Thermoanaerobaculia bacterium]